jgi:hypothetical protein
MSPRSGHLQVAQLLSAEAQPPLLRTRIHHKLIPTPRIPVTPETPCPSYSFSINLSKSFSVSGA